MKENLLVLKDLSEFKKKNFKHMTAVSKNVYTDKLDYIINEYNNTYHRTTNMKPIEDNRYTDYNDKDPKFKVGDHVRKSKCKNIFAKGFIPNWSEELFVIKELKNNIPWTYVINDLNVEEIIEIFYQKELQKNKSTRT